MGIAKAKALTPSLDERIQAQAAWILEHAPHVAAEQDHLDEGTRESAYWHLGYLMALLEVRESWCAAGPCTSRRPAMLTAQVRALKRD